MVLVLVLMLLDDSVVLFVPASSASASGRGGGLGRRERKAGGRCGAGARARALPRLALSSLRPWGASPVQERVDKGVRRIGTSGKLCVCSFPIICMMQKLHVAHVSTGRGLSSGPHHQAQGHSIPVTRPRHCRCQHSWVSCLPW